MRFRLGTWAVCLALSTMANGAHAAEPDGSAVVVVLDCSLRMAESLEQEGTGAAVTRFAAARAALLSTASAAAAQEDLAIGVVCFGHRLAWDEGEQPDLVEQSDYLSQTAGFPAISSLLPGNDVEILRRPLRLSAEDARFATPILESLRPWGEAPVNRALVLANRQFGAAGANSGIVLITAGGDKIGQSGAKYTRQQVLEGYYKRRIPVHVVAVGAANAKDASWNDLQLIARRSHGSFQAVTSKSDVEQAVKLAVNAVVQGEELPDSVEDLRQAETLPRPATATPIGDTRAPAPLRNATVEGVVLYYGRPLPKARVTIDGLAAPTAVADSTGEFRFNNVPPGRYEVRVIGSAHHQPYSGASTLIVPDSSDEPLFMEFDLR